MTNDDYTDRDVDRLLRGDEVAALADATPMIEALRALSVAPTEAESARAGAALARVAAGSSSPAVGPAATPPSRWRVRAAIAGGLALVGAAAVGGVAAADEAAPGDPLYALDIALEDLGIGDGGTEERCDEAVKMDEEGDTEGALEHVAESVEADGDSAETLLAVAAKLRENGSESSAEVHERVAAMLEWMATTDATGKEFGQGVSQHARGIYVDPAEEVAGDVPVGTDEESAVETEAPGKSGDAPGKTGEKGKPDTTEKSTGKPESPGKSGSAGKPESTGKP